MNTNVLLVLLVLLCAIDRAESNNIAPSSADSSVDSSSMGSDSVPIAVLQFDGDSHHHSRIVRERIVDDIYFGTETIPVYATETKFVYDYGPDLYDLDASVTSTVYSTSTSIIINEWNQYTTTLRKRHHHRPCPEPIIPPYFPPDYYPYDPYDGYDYYDPYDDYYFDNGFDFVDDFVDDFFDDNLGRNNQPVQETTQIFHIKNECCPNNDNGNGNIGGLDFGDNRGLIDNVIDIVEPNGGEIIIDEQYDPNTGDFRELIEIIEPNNGSYFPNNNNGNYFPNNNNGNNGNYFPNNNNGTNGNYFPNNNNGNYFPNNNNGNRGLIDNVIDIIEPNGGEIIIDEQFNPNTGGITETIEILGPNNGGIFNGNTGRSVSGNTGIYYPNNTSGTIPIYNNGNRSVNNASTLVGNLVETIGNANYSSLGIGGGNRSTGIFSGTVECTCDRQFPGLQNLLNSRGNETRSVYETNAGIGGTFQSSNYSSGGRSIPVAQSGILENINFSGRSNPVYVGETTCANGTSQPNVIGSNIASRIQEVAAPQASTPATSPAQRQAPTAAKSAKTTPQPKPGQPRKPLLTSSSLSSSMLDSDFDEDFMFTSGADFSIHQGMKSAIFGLVIFAIVFVF